MSVPPTPGTPKTPPAPPTPGTPSIHTARTGGGSKAGSDKTTVEVLKQIQNLEQEAGLAYTEIPPELLQGRELALDRWSLIATDGNLVTIARATCERVDEKQAEILAATRNPAARDTRVMSVREAAKARARTQATESVGLLELHLNGATEVGDVGLKALGEQCASTLRVFKLSGATRVSDVGLRCVGTRATCLVELDLSGCVGVRGVGLASFGECANGLVKLTLAHCHNLEAWAFQRLVCGCHLLEEVDVSCCHQLGDVDVGVMAANCAKVRKLNLRDAKQLSDLALVEVAKRCPALEWVDTSRSELPWKITDVGILGLSEGCPLLHTLVAQGCDQLTDVALAWLGRGCRALTHLDLKHCAKISNAGVRALAEGCYELQYLDLTSLKGVTDTGVRSLAANCPNLTHLDLNGMYMLTDGKARDFGLEGLQALCSLSNTLEHLHLVGCFQVAKGALKCLRTSGFAHCLRDLSLSGCTKLDEAAFVKMAHTLPRLTAVSLALCGECVTEPMVVALGKGPSRRNLTRLDLAECPWVGAHALKAVLRGCRALSWLNLTKCVKVDDLALMPLSELPPGHFAPGLETLILCGCSAVGDAGLAWLASGIFKTNVSLNLKGTRCTSSGLRSVQDLWRYSDPKKTATFLGLWPQKRWPDQVWINGYWAQYKAARRIQALARKVAGRARFDAVKQQAYREWVALKLQSVWRAIVAREAFLLLKWAHARRVHAQTVLRGFARIILAKRRRQQLRARRDLGVAELACIKVQTRYRIRLARGFMQGLRDEAAALAKHLRHSAVTVQRTWRGWLGRKKFRALVAAKEALRVKRDGAARKLQRHWRGSAARRLVAQNRRTLADRAALEQRSVVKLQQRFRAHRCKRVVARAARQRGEFERAAVKLQAAWRAKEARAFLTLTRLILQQEAEEAAALTLSCWARTLKAQWVVAAKRRAQQENLLAQAGSAVTIERVYRGHAARRRCRDLKRKAEELQRKMVELENWAAVRLQALWRGYSGRLRAFQAMRAHKGKWKEMWDPEKRRPFYYNQISGEIRWRTPQALLDLKRRPVCHNCEFYEAVVECQNCIEYYCNSCWETVHYSGKRKRHKFRCLYDYYEKRVDYGDTEFPSRWPSEVEQDEMVGWQLRVGESQLGAEHDRLPGEVRGSWEAYQDTPDLPPLEGVNRPAASNSPGKSKGKGSGGGQVLRTFYYNRATEEGMYEEPPEWRLALGRSGGGAAQAQAVRPTPPLTAAYPSSSSSSSIPYASAATTGKWSTLYDPGSGQEYYQNEVTGESTYEQPPELLQLGDASAAGAAYTPSGGGYGGGSSAQRWEKHFDDEYQVDYWYDAATGEASYEQPLELGPESY